MADLSFLTPDDTDINELDSVQPITYGEDAAPLNWNRPTDRLRERSERLRVGVNENAYLIDESTRITISSSSVTVDWDGSWDGSGTAPAPGLDDSGSFALSGDIAVTTLLSSGAARLGPPDPLIYGGGAGGFSSIFSWMDSSDAGPSGTNTIRVVSKIFSHEGGDWVDFEVVDAGTNLVSPIVEVLGEPPVSGGDGFAPRKAHIKVSISDGTTNVTTIAEVISAVQGNVDANAILEVYDHPITPSAATSDPMWTIAKTRLTRGLNAVVFEITQSNLASFFTSTDDKRLREGDCLAISFADLQTRRGNILEKGSISIQPDELVNLSYTPEKAAGAIPICRVVNGDLHFVNGTVIQKFTAATPLPRLLQNHSSSIETPQITLTGTQLDTQSVEGQLAELLDYIEPLYDGTGTFTFTSLTTTDLTSDEIVANDRIGINQDPPDASTRLHITDATGAYVRLERDDTTIDTPDVYGEIHAYGSDVGGSGIRAALTFEASANAGHTDVVLKASGAGATLQEHLRVNHNDGVTIQKGLRADAENTTTQVYVGVDQGTVEFRDLRDPILSANLSIGQLDWYTDETGNEGATLRLQGITIGTGDEAALRVLARGAAVGDAGNDDEVARFVPGGATITNGALLVGYTDRPANEALAVSRHQDATGSSLQVLGLGRTMTNAALDNDGISQTFYITDTARTDRDIAAWGAGMVESSFGSEDVSFFFSQRRGGTFRRVMYITPEGTVRAGLGGFGNDQIDKAALPFYVEQGAAAGVGEMLFIKEHTSSGAVASGATLRQTFVVRDHELTPNIENVAQLDYIWAPVAANNGRIEVKVRRAGSSLDKMFEIDGYYNRSTFIHSISDIPFDFDNSPAIAELSHVQIVHSLNTAGLIGSRGLDIGNTNISNSDGARGSSINFLGIHNDTVDDRHRLGGVACAHDGTGTDFYGRLSLFVNATNNDEDAVTEWASLRANGRFQAKNTCVAFGRYDPVGGDFDPTASFGVSSIVDNTGGDYTITLTDAFSAANGFCPVASLENNTAAYRISIRYLATTNTFRVHIESPGVGGVAGQPFTFSVFGTLA